MSQTDAFEEQNVAVEGQTAGMANERLNETYIDIFGGDDIDVEDLSSPAYSSSEAEDNLPSQVSRSKSTAHVSRASHPPAERTRPEPSSSDDDATYREQRRPKKRRLIRKSDVIVHESSDEPDAGDGSTGESMRRKIHGEKITPAPLESARKLVDEHFDAFLKKPTRKRKGEEVLDSRDDEANYIRDLMMRAANRDRSANQKGTPAEARLLAFEEVSSTLSKSAMIDVLMECGILEAIKVWMEPLSDGSLPNFIIQRFLFECLEKYPVTTDHLRSTGIGKLVRFYEVHPYNHEAIKRRARKLVQKWSMPIFNKSMDYRHMKSVQEATAAKQHWTNGLMPRR